MGRTLRHLSHRFFEVLFAKQLDIDELTTAASWVPPELWELFVAQQPADQRHGFHSAAKVAAVDGLDSDVVVAAMMHDIGKRHSRLGALGRSLATLLMALGAPLSKRFAMYRDHGAIGADELETAGAPHVAVLFARHHQGDRPEALPERVWSTLIWADEPGIPEGARNPE